MSAGFEIVGLVSRGATSRAGSTRTWAARYPEFGDYEDGARRDTARRRLHQHVPGNARRRMRSRRWKPARTSFSKNRVADNLDDCETVIEAARRLQRKLVVGYILHVHPSGRGSPSWPARSARRS